MKCRLCMQEAKLVDAHIIPRSFFEAIKPNGRQDHLVMVSSETSVFDKICRIGVYDPAILCLTCEKLFSPWDDYASRLLLAEARPEDILDEDSGKPIARVIASYDYEQLMLFFVSLLWRASVSKQPFYSRIKTGPHEEILRQIILGKDLSLNTHVSVLLAQFVNYDDPSQTFFDPYLTRFEHLNLCVFFFATYIAYIKLDRRPLPSSWNEAALKPGKSITIILREFHGSSDEHVFSEIARATRMRAMVRARRRNLPRN